MSKLFDKMKSATGSEAEKAVIEATLHTAKEPPPEKYVRRLVLSTSAGSSENAAIAASLKKRLDELDWKIVLKALIVTHTLTREGDLQFAAEMLMYSDKFRYLSRFADLSSGVAHTQSTFVRPYSTYIGARLKTYAETRQDYEREPQRTKEMSANVAIDKYPVFAAQMDALLACKTESNTATNALIIAVLQLLVRDTLRLYQVMSLLISRLIEDFPRQTKENERRILDHYRTFIAHTDGLNTFYEGVRQQVPDCPSPLKVPPTSLRSLEAYMENNSADNNPPIEKLNLGPSSPALVVQQQIAGAQPIYTGATASAVPPMVQYGSQTNGARGSTGNPFAAPPAPSGGAPAYPAGVFYTPSAPAPATSYAGNPYAAAQPGSPINLYSGGGGGGGAPATNPFAAPSGAYGGSPATQPKYPTPPAPATASYGSPSHSAANPYAPSSPAVNPFAAKPAAPTSPPQLSLGAIASALQNPSAPAPAPWAAAPASPPASQPSPSPFAPVMPQYGAATAPPTSPPQQSSQSQLPSAAIQAQLSAAAGQQQMLYYRLPTGEFVAVPASALQGMQLSAVPPASTAPAAAPANPFGN